MELFSVFITYFARMLRRVWWQVGLVGLLVRLPQDLASTYADSVFDEISETVHYTLFSYIGYLTADLLLWSFGMALILLILRESELIQKELHPEHDSKSEDDALEVQAHLPSNFATAAWDLWSPRWGRLTRQALHLWPRMILTRLISNFAFLISWVLLCIPGVYLSVKLAVTEPVVVRDGVMGIGAIYRSCDLTEGRFWKIFWLQILGFLFLMVIIVPVIILIAVLAYFYPVLLEPHFWFVMGVLTMPVNLAVAYFGVFMYSLYNFLNWDRRNPEDRPVEEFLDYDPDAPVPVFWEPIPPRGEA